MKKIIMSGCIATLLLAPGLGFADEIEPNFMAGYRMGFFMAVAAGNSEKLCGNVHFQSMNEVIKTYTITYGEKYPLKYNEALDLQTKYFACPTDPSISRDKK